jgi:integrase
LSKIINVKGKKADAERRMRELLASLDRGLPINTGKLTVSEWFDRWIDEHIAPNRRQRTTERYRDVCRNHIKPYLGHMRLTRLTPSDIKALEATWAGQGMTAHGIQYGHRVLSAALKSAVKMELLYRNPALVVDPPRPEKREVRPPDVRTVNDLLDASEREGDRFYPALRLIAYTGIRRGECLGLHWRDVDLARQEITITASLVRSAEKGLILEPPKSKASRRVINLDDGTAQVLGEHKVRQMEQRLVLGSTYQDSDFAFPDEFGLPLNPMALTRALQRAARRAGSGHIKLHDLRHFHASLLLQSGQSPVLVSKRLGHSTVSMTLDVYGHLMPGWQREAAEVFAKAMSQGN